MTPQEAETIARVIGTADGGCSVCVGNLADKLNKANLGYQWTATHERILDQDTIHSRLIVTVTPRP